MNTKGPGQPQTVLSEINVTPFVDVMLVLLIIFMVSAPLMQSGVQVDLPKASTGSLEEAEEKVTLSAEADRSLSINGKKIPKGTLQTKLAAMVQTRPGLQVLVQADQSLPYGFVAEIMAEVKASHVNRVGLVTLPGNLKSRL